MKTNTTKTAEELKRSEALEKAFFETFGISSEQYWENFWKEVEQYKKDLNKAK